MIVLVTVKVFCIIASGCLFTTQCTDYPVSKMEKPPLISLKFTFPFIPFNLISEINSFGVKIVNFMIVLSLFIMGLGLTVNDQTKTSARKP
ncbi:MAG: hypothetical protein IJ122_04655 [Methanobrevibacter sp.]|nr:hypothetical protein [Methanobrevibacter sp.]